MRRLIAATIGLAAFVGGVAVAQDDGPRPVSELQYVQAESGDSFWSLARELALSCTHTELWAANGRAPLDPGTIVLIPPNCTDAPETTTTTTTTVAPTTTAQPSGDITHGSQLTAADVGPTGPLAPSGSITTSRDGQVIEDVDVSGSINVIHDDVTIRNCRVRYNGTGYGIDAANGTTGTVIERCEVVGANAYQGFGIYIRDGAVRWSNIRGYQTGIYAGSGATIEWNRVTEPAAVSGTHGTGVSLNYGGTGVVRGNWIDGNTSSSLALYANSPFTDVLVESNYFGGKGGSPSFCLNAGSNKNGVGSNRNVRVIDNVFGTDTYPECGQYGAFFNWDGSRPGARWCDNRFVNGTRVGSDVGCN